MGLIEDVYKVLAGTCGFQLKTGFTALYITITVLGLQRACTILYNYYACIFMTKDCIY